MDGSLFKVSPRRKSKWNGTVKCKITGDAVQSKVSYRGALGHQEKKDGPFR